MKKWSNKKAEWLLVMLAVSLTASASWTITAEEKSEAIDRYIIVELETLTAPNVDAEEMELSSESEQSTEETVEVESEPEVVLFSLQASSPMLPVAIRSRRRISAACWNTASIC